MTGSPAAIDEAMAGAARKFRSMTDAIDAANARGGPAGVAALLRPDGTSEERARVAAHYQQRAAGEPPAA